MSALAWEMVGYVGSWAAGDGRDISLRAQAQCLVDWLDALAIERAVLVGRDLGGGVAQIVAVEYPARRGVLTNAVSYDSWPIPGVEALRLAGGAVAAAPRVVARGIIASVVLRGTTTAAAPPRRSRPIGHPTTTRAGQERSCGRCARCGRRTPSPSPGVCGRSSSRRPSYAVPPTDPRS